VDTLQPAARDDFLHALEGALAGARQEGQCLGLVLIDLSNLGRINHRLGYAEGDRLLRRIQAELLALSTLPETVFRVAGHGFAFILPGLQNPGFIALGGHRIRQVLDHALQAEELSESPHLCLGMAVAGGPCGYSVEQVLATAEANLVQARLSGGVVMDGLVEPAAPGTVVPGLTHQFGDALRDGALELYFQPKVDLRSGRVCGAEALLRWYLDATAVSPQRVVALAEREGELFALCKSVLHRALRQLHQWGERYLQSLSVNLPAQLLTHPELLNTLRDALRIWSVPPSRLVLEITEDALFEDKEAGRLTLLELRALGVGLSIDDFGTGYSSLSYFQHIPAQELKIDRSFVARMFEQDRYRELVRIIIDIAHLFELQVVAEGVEEERTLRALRELGCDSVQGYLYARPMAADAFIRWLQVHDDAFVGPARPRCG
jgi:diguanylate cyclase (GGDEF)-like protein